MKIILLSFFAFYALGCSQSSITSREDLSGLNLDFENVGARNRPTKWYVSAGKSYTVELDSGTAVSGRRSLRITFVQQAQDDASYAWTSKLPVDDVRGKKVTYTGYIRTADLTDGSACLWFRVDGPSDTVLAYDTMDVTGVSGTTEWKQYTIELSIDSSAINTDFGVRHDGKGIAWFDKFEILIDGKPYERQVFTATDEQIEWLKQEAQTFNTPLAGSGFEDLAFVKNIVGDAEIVGLGEATHGTKEFFQMKHRLTEYLANNAGFTVFAIEAGMPEAHMINDYVLGGSGNVRELMKELSVFWNTKEVESMIEWMRAFNASGKGHIEFMGFDMQADTIAAENVITFLKKNDPGYAYTARVKYDTLRRRMARAEETQSYGDQSFASSIHDAAAILSHMQGANYIKTASQKEIDWAMQNATIVMQAAQHTLTDLFYSPSYRDSCMAVNIKWIKDHSPPDTKLVVWAHDGHIAKRDSWMMGSYLDKMYGSKYRPFGFKFHEGTYTAWANGAVTSSNVAIPSYPGTLDWILHSLNMPHFILDLQKASATDSRSDWLYQKLETKVISAMANDEYAIGRVADEFDAIIFFDKTTASERLTETIK